MPVDIWNREVKVGDIVIPTNESTFYTYSQKAHVVTRLGSGTKIQLNGGSYGQSDMMIVVNEQFVTQFGVAAAEELVAQYREAINEEPVKKKQPTPKFLVYRCFEYKYENNRRVNPELKDVWYAVVKVAGTSQEIYQQLKPLQELMKSKLGEYYDNRTLSENRDGLKWYYSSINHALTMKKLKELKLDGLIGEVFNAEAEEAEFLNTISVY